ncbi:MAG: hypothetical protein JWO82_4450 [Akkermansiaceae bacterium]|nr:hypothetical protein [Akkermansiaceae bacterium]
MGQFARWAGRLQTAEGCACKYDSPRGNTSGAVDFAIGNESIPPDLKFPQAFRSNARFPPGYAAFE